MTNPSRNRIKTLILTQMFTLFLALAMPLLTRLLTYTAGKILYAFFAVVCVGLSIELRRLLQGSE